MKSYDNTPENRLNAESYSHESLSAFGNVIRDTVELLNLIAEPDNITFSAEHSTMINPEAWNEASAFSIDTFLSYHGNNLAGELVLHTANGRAIYRRNRGGWAHQVLDETIDDASLLPLLDRSRLDPEQATQTTDYPQDLLPDTTENQNSHDVFGAYKVLLRGCADTWREKTEFVQHELIPLENGDVVTNSSTKLGIVPSSDGIFSHALLDVSTIEQGCLLGRKFTLNSDGKPWLDKTVLSLDEGFEDHRECADIVDLEIMVRALDMLCSEKYQVPVAKI